MSTLEIDYDAYRIETMWQWSDPSSTPSPHYTARIAKTSINRRGNILTAYLTPKGSASEPTPVILKMAYGMEHITSLEREARMYENELRHLQGTVVPIYYGLYHGQTESRYQSGLREKVACMVLEYCSSTDGMHPVDLGRNIVACTLSLHQAGIVHNDLLNTRNIVQSADGGVRFLDFATASRRHLCPTSVCKHGGGCQEIALVERQYGGPTPQVPGYHGRW